MPSGQTVHIPLRKLFWIWEREASRNTPLNPTGNLGLTPVTLWQTTPGLIGQTTINPNNSNDYRDATLEVTAGNTPYGNAVIAIQQNGETLWSFHIWVTSYDPDNGGPVFTYPGKAPLMDRNLGSNGDYTNFTDIIPTESAGLYYQWGRKDPFPGARNLLDCDLQTATNQFPIYDAGGARQYITFEPVNASKNLENSIHNPTRFYTNGAEYFPMNDWYTNATESKYQNDNLWNDTQKRKTVFDPCPAGWRVPSETDMNVFWPSNFPGTYEFANNSYATFTLGGNSIIFPTGGFIVDGDLEQAGADQWGRGIATLWDRETYQTEAVVEIYSTIVYEYAVNTRKLGLSVRCIKDTHDWRFQ
ncbi:MAG: hypothetical protein LUE93_13225 [Bacteroides sp.]|nr:hypothetical protein [Bacteroides sp.]